jgi:uncharacterized protein (TIGR02677 family)
VDRGDEDDIGPWRLTGPPGGLTVASYLTAPDEAAAQYRLIVDTLLDEQAYSLTGVSHADLEMLLRRRQRHHPGDRQHDHPGDHLAVLAALPLDLRLDQLVAWGVAAQWPGPTGDRRYQLTAAAARLHQAVRRLGPDLADPDPDPAASVAASAAPPVLAAELGRLAASLPGEPAIAAQAWSVLHTTFTAMTEAAAGWQARLAAAQAGAADPARVAALQDALRRYVDVWASGVDRHCGPIAAHTSGLLAAGPAAWRPAALHSLGAAVPEDRLSALLAGYRATLTGLLTWFGPGDNAARQLSRQLRDVVVPLVNGHRALPTVRGQLSQRADLLALAGALERSTTDDTAWSLWCAATGLFAARHLPHPSPQPSGPAGSISFWVAEPVPVTALGGPWPGGPGARPGVPPGDQVARMPDRSVARALARATATAQQDAAEQTQHAIAARSGLWLSGWTGLDAGQLDVLLSFLAVLPGARPGPDGSRTVRTPDGRWTIRAEPAPDGAPPAVIRTPAGQLVHPDLRLTITAARPALAGSLR